jgi:hypothetical protein
LCGKMPWNSTVKPPANPTTTAHTPLPGSTRQTAEGEVSIPPAHKKAKLFRHTSTRIQRSMKFRERASSYRWPWQVDFRKGARRAHRDHVGVQYALVGRHKGKVDQVRGRPKLPVGDHGWQVLLLQLPLQLPARSSWHGAEREGGGAVNKGSALTRARGLALAAQLERPTVPWGGALALAAWRGVGRVAGRVLERISSGNRGRPFPPDPCLASPPRTA